MANYKTPDECPTCGGEYTMQCRCLLGNRRCANGHEWHRCQVHGVVPCGGYHGKDPRANGCSCEGASEEGSGI